MRIRSFSFAALALAAFALTTPAFANLSSTCTGYFISDTAGYINASGYTADAASACVTLSGSTITVTLENDTTPITNVPNMLVGFSFSIAGGGTAAGITGVTSGIGDTHGQFLDCKTNPCTYTNTFVDQNTSTTLGSPYTWGAGNGSTTYGSSSFTGTFGGANPGLFAGNVTGGGPDNQTGIGTQFSLHPGAIMNDSATSSGGLTNSPHNDTLLSDVSFTLTCTGTCTGFSNGVFYWGTDGISTAGQVPEPTSILLLGTVLAVTGKLLKSRLGA